MGRLLLGMLLGTSACAKHLPPTLTPAEIVPYETTDGWSNDLRHYPGDGSPVLLVHGMGANHYNFDYREEVSLSDYLQDAGWDVWVVELRGDPGSRPPSRKAWRSYDFDDHARYDLPAAVDTILERTEHERLFWVGHSMGGMLLYTALADYPEKVEAGVAICSPSTLQEQKPLHRSARAFAWAVKGNGRIHAEEMAKLASPLGRANPLYGRLGNRKNMSWPVVNGMAREALVDLTRPTAHEVVGWLKAGEVVTHEGEPWIRPSDVPVMVMGASIDHVVPHENVEHACTVFSNCTYRLLGTQGGFSSEMGHVDPVVGKTARSEVYPVVLQFLADHGDTEAAAQAD
jgi:pimeloyl-ACP methyl ester carboxylesterase